MTQYFRPIAQSGAARPNSAQSLAGGWAWFTHVERLERGQQAEVVPASEMPEDWQNALTHARPGIAWLDMTRPLLMGILNVTPDSFSDGGAHVDPLAHARKLVEDGADLIDVGGESTRPGAELVATETEIARVAPVMKALRRCMPQVPVSIDTRKAAVASAARADLINDVSGFTYVPGLIEEAAQTRSPVCVMHSKGDPETMQNDPRYDDVLLDVYDWLAERIGVLETAGIPRGRILVDPGIGFGKTLEHNLALLRGISLFHGLGCGILLGASRKGFIGRIGNAPDARSRAPGSAAVALAAISQGIQVIRAHDIAEHAQAIALWRACMA
jgi:dihydropteroate synthase